MRGFIVILISLIVSPAYAGDASSLIHKYAREMGVPVDLAMRVARQESGVRCVSTRKYYGPLQIDYRTAKGMGLSTSAAVFRKCCDLQVRYGMKHLSTALRKSKGNHVRAACLHNRGLGAKCGGHTKYTHQVFGRKK